MIKIKRALISVSDKTGIVEFARALNEFGVEILSTGGTARTLQEAGIAVRQVSEYTGSPEMLDGRVKTLHPKIHGGLLALRNNPEHIKQVKAYALELIDMVVVNLYPFEKVVAKENATQEEAIENIDIGGPAMLRSAAKNFSSVVVICEPARYGEIIGELRQNKGAISAETSRRLAQEAFQTTSRYDGAIFDYLAGARKEAFPERLVLRLERVQELRYGENPHQKAAFYKEGILKGACVAGARQLQGKELSFNNILDLNSALELVCEFDAPACAIIKHNNPCGVAVGKTLAAAFRDALACDRLSAFGGIVGLNRKMDLQTARAIVSSEFIECVIAPGYAQGAIAAFAKKKNLRVMEVAPLLSVRDPHLIGVGSPTELDFKKVVGGLLVQDRDLATLDKASLKVVTKKRPTKAQMKSLLFAWTVAKHTKSNAIILARGERTVGIGAGQMSRVDSVMLAARKAARLARGAVLASDAFFPKEDAIQQAKRASAVAIIQPGGSIRDGEIIKAANKAGIAMVFTGMRHFRH